MREYPQLTELEEICMKNITPFVTLLFISLAISIPTIAADKEEIQLYTEYCKLHTELPPELKTIFEEKEADYFNKLLYFRDNLLRLSLNELKTYNELIIVLSPNNSLPTNQLNPLSEGEITDDVIGLERNKIIAARLIDRDRLLLTLHTPEVKNITHQLLVDTYALSLRFFSIDTVEDHDLEYIARIVYHVRLSPQLIVTLLDEKIPADEFSKQLFGKNLVEISMKKKDGNAFIFNKTLHTNFKNVFFRVLIEDGIVPLYLLPMTIIPYNATVVADPTKDSSESTKWSMEIANYISPQHRIQYGINAPQPLALMKQYPKNTYARAQNTSYLVDEEWAHVIVNNARSRTDDKKDKKIIAMISTEKAFHRLSINDAQTYVYQVPVNSEEKKRHAALSYFLHHQERVCDPVKWYGRKLHTDNDRKEYNKAVISLKTVLPANQQTKPYLTRINTVSSLTHWNEFKFSFWGILTGIHGKLTAATAIPQYYGLLQVFPRLLNPCYVLSGLFAWRILSCFLTHTYHKCNITIDTQNMPLWKYIPYFLGMCVVAAPEYMHYGFYDRSLNKDVELKVK